MIFNLRDLELEEVDGRFSARSLTPECGASLTGTGVYELPPGAKHWPYHFEVIDEEWLFVIAGEVVLRTEGGEQVLRPGDIACFPAGSAHGVRNDSDAVARFAMLSARPRFGGDAVVYPDSAKFVIRSTNGFSHRGFLGDEAEYWEGEA